MRTHACLFVLLTACEVKSTDGTECLDPGPVGISTMNRVTAACTNFAAVAAQMAQSAVMNCGNLPADTAAAVPVACFTDLATRLEFECEQMVLCSFDVEFALATLHTACGGTGTLAGMTLSLGQNACDWWPSVEATASCGGEPTSTGYTLPLTAYDLCPCLLTRRSGEVSTAETGDTATYMTCL